VGRDAEISTRQAIEICSFIRGLPLAKAKAMLEKVMDKKLAVPFRRFTNGAGHKKGIGSGKHPLKASIVFIGLLNSLEANAQNKGLGTNLVIVHACAQEASRPYHYGRKRRIKVKRTHVELAAQEVEESKKQEKKQDAKQKQPAKADAKAPEDKKR
jgi:large subunit ribosomal protein L22